jgi:hypothetical protein
MENVMNSKMTILSAAIFAAVANSGDAFATSSDLSTDIKSVQSDVATSPNTGFGNLKPLQNHLDNLLKAVSGKKIKKKIALKKIEQALDRVDGCETGNGPDRNDALSSCTDSSRVYASLMIIKQKINGQYIPPVSCPVNWISDAEIGNKYVGSNTSFGHWDDTKILDEVKFEGYHDVNANGEVWPTQISSNSIWVWNYDTVDTQDAIAWQWIETTYDDTGAVTNSEIKEQIIVNITDAERVACEDTLNQVYPAWITRWN